MASRATRMFWKDPRMCIRLLSNQAKVNSDVRMKSQFDFNQALDKKERISHVSARTILVLVEFSIVNLVLPLLPARRPMHLARCSPLSVCYATFETEGLNRGRQKRNVASEPPGQGRLVAAREGRLIHHINRP